MTREMRSLKVPRVFLESEFSIPADNNLINQVELWSMNRGVFVLYGPDVERPVGSGGLERFNHLSTVYDRWYNHWSRVLNLDTEIASLGRSLLDLYLSCSKLCLFSHIYRGKTQQEPSVEDDARARLQQSALDSAGSVLRLVTNGHIAFGWLERLPAYFRIMLGFAAVYLMNTSAQILSYSSLGVVEQMIETIRSSSVVASPMHPFSAILHGLEASRGRRSMSQADVLFKSPDSHLAYHRSTPTQSIEGDLDLGFLDNRNDGMELFGDFDGQP